MTPPPKKLYQSPLLLVAAFLLALLAVIPRFVNLGARAVMHDESMFAFYSYDTLVHMNMDPPIGPDGKILPKMPNYTHMPIMHGPLLELGTACVFGAIGDSMARARAIIALSSLAMLLAGILLWPRNLRWWLAPLLITSPVLLFYSRFFRNDILFCAFLNVGLLGIVLGTRRGPWRIPGAVIGVTLLFGLLTIMENALFVYASAATFWGVLLIERLVYRFKPNWHRALRKTLRVPQVRHPLARLAEPPAKKKKKQKETYLKPSFAVVTGEASSPAQESSPQLPSGQRSPFWRRVDRFLPWIAGALCGFAFVAVIFGGLVGQAGVNLNPDPENSKALFTIASYINTHPGVHSKLEHFGWLNLVASWQYWSDQHQQHRISGPLHYHLMILLTYELPVIILLYVGMAWDAFLRRGRALLYALGFSTALGLMSIFKIKGAPLKGDEAGAIDKLLDFLHLEPNLSLLAISLLIIPMLVWSILKLIDRKPLAAWMGWWAACSMFQYASAGEKVPWLAMHIALPLYMMLGWVWGPLLRNRRVETRAVFFAAAIIAALIGWRSDVRFLGDEMGNPRERLVFNHTSNRIDKAIKERLEKWRLELNKIPLEDRRILLVDDPAIGGPSWPGIWYFRHCYYLLSTDPAPQMNQQWDLVLGTKSITQPLVDTIDKEKWQSEEMSLRDHWWAPWPQEELWNRWLSGSADALGNKPDTWGLLSSTADMWWRYYWNRETWAPEPGVYPIIMLRPTAESSINIKP